MKAYAKAIWAFVASAIGAVTTAVAATPSQSFGQVSDLGWLLAAGYVVAVTGGVYGFKNDPLPVPTTPVVDAAKQAQIASLEAEIATYQTRLEAMKNG